MPSCTDRKGLPHWCQTSEDEDGRFWSDCRCGWSSGPHATHRSATGHGYGHREVNQAENDNYARVTPQ
jgi:hypothetical protein